MSSTDLNVTVVGNLTADPELRFTPSGKAVASFTVANTPRRYDRNTQEWKDGEATFLRASVWGDQAQQLAESLQRGMRVVAVGRLKQRSFETREGEKRTVIELDADEVAASVRYAHVKVHKIAREHFGDGDQARGSDAEDPWASAPTGPSEYVPNS